MSAPNFSFQRRCILVENENIEWNSPSHAEYFDNDRSYPSCYLDKWKDEFSTVAIVITSGYYQDACIDIVDREDKANELLGYTYHYSRCNREELLNDICYYLGCSKTFANKRLKGCNINRPGYENAITKAFEKIVEDWRDVEVEKANKILDKIKEDYGYIELSCDGVFSNGEAIYSVIK